MFSGALQESWMQSIMSSFALHGEHLGPIFKVIDVFQFYTYIRMLEGCET